MKGLRDRDRLRLLHLLVSVSVLACLDGPASTFRRQPSPYAGSRCPS
jgi:hypothetical protein